ncbi:MAG: GxxExxY protein [Candidatus Moraniibacteriota bacterium]
MNLIKNKNIYYPELSYEITGLLFKVHNNSGRFKSERQYYDIFEELLKENKIIYSREVELKKLFNNIIENGNIPDFIIENKIIIDFKTKKFITKEDYYQMLRYLEAVNFPLGLIVNFRSTYLKPKRVINSKYHSDNSSVNS